MAQCQVNFLATSEKLSLRQTRLETFRPDRARAPPSGGCNFEIAHPATESRTLPRMCGSAANSKGFNVSAYPAIWCWNCSSKNLSFAFGLMVT